MSPPPPVQTALSVLHDNAATLCPALLPVVRRLASEVHTERARALQVRPMDTLIKAPI
jgi:hypothetical protein